MKTLITYLLATSLMLPGFSTATALMIAGAQNPSPAACAVHEVCDHHDHHNAHKDCAPYCTHDHAVKHDGGCDHGYAASFDEVLAILIELDVDFELVYVDGYGYFFLVESIEDIIGRAAFCPPGRCYMIINVRESPPNFTNNPSANCRYVTTTIWMRCAWGCENSFVLDQRTHPFNHRWVHTNPAHSFCYYCGIHR
jgi:hypothetical protein